MKIIESICSGRNGEQPNRKRNIIPITVIIPRNEPLKINCLYLKNISCSNYPSNSREIPCKYVSQGYSLGYLLH